MDIVIFLLYIAVFIGIMATAFYVLSFIEYGRRKPILFKDSEVPNVTIIIPAYNEEESIARTIKSILGVSYDRKKFEVIVVDDGSNDKTYEIAKKFEGKYVRVFTKENGGKASALNFGIEKSKGDIIFSMDADTIVTPHSVLEMAKFFKNPNIMSVTPAMLVAKPKSILQRIQQIEYALGIFLRKAFAALDSIYIAPGAFTAYRKTFFDKYGGYDIKNITEDLELALRIQYYGYKTENAPTASVFTNSPSKFKPLMIQRRRWYFGLIKNTIKYRKLFSHKYGDLGMFVMPIAWISILFSIIFLIRFIIKGFIKIKSSLVFIDNINYDFLSLLNFNLIALEKTLFIAFSSPMFLFVLLFLFILAFYLYYANKKAGAKNSNVIFNLILFIIFFAPLFAFWWIVSLFYAFFYKEIKWG